MEYRLLYHPEVGHRDVPKLNRDLRSRIERAIRERLTTSPELYGRPLRGTLKGYWKLRVGDYRVVFRIAGTEAWVLGIGNRRDVYDWIQRRGGWRPAAPPPAPPRGSR